MRHHKYPKYMLLEELKYNVLALFWINCHLFSEGFVPVRLSLNEFVAISSVDIKRADF